MKNSDGSIVTPEQVKSGIVKIPSGYYSLVSAINPDGARDEFYFNYHGYQPSQGEFGNGSFWSSSVVSNSFFYAYVLEGKYGFTNYGDRVYSRIAVLCVPVR